MRKLKTQLRERVVHYQKKKFTPIEPFREQKHYKMFLPRKTLLVNPLVDPAEALKVLAFHVQFERPVPPKIKQWFFHGALSRLNPKNKKSLEMLLGLQKSTKGRTPIHKKGIEYRDESIILCIAHFLGQGATPAQAIMETIKYRHNKVYVGEETIIKIYKKNKPNILILVAMKQVKDRLPETHPLKVFIKTIHELNPSDVEIEKARTGVFPLFIEMLGSADKANEILDDIIGKAHIQKAIMLMNG